MTKREEVLRILRDHADSDDWHRHELAATKIVQLFEKQEGGESHVITPPTMVMGVESG